MTLSASGRPGDAQAANIILAAGGSSLAQCFCCQSTFFFLNGDTLEQSNESCRGPSSPPRALEDVSGSPPALLQFSGVGQRDWAGHAHAGRA